MLSVVIPVFNRPRQVLRAVDSVLSQSDVDETVEIIVVNDGSWQKIEFGNRPVKVVFLARNSGPAAARNAGVKASHGELILFLDSDDVWLPEKLALQTRFFRETANCRDAALHAVTCGFYYPNRWTAALEARRPRASASAFEFASGCWFAPGSTMLVHRSAFDAVGPFDESFERLEDFDWFIRFGACGGRLHVIPYIGAVVAPSRAQTVPALASSMKSLEAKFLPNGPSALPARAWRHLKAYGHLEQGVAAYTSGQFARAALHLARSLSLVPRARVNLVDFWQRTKSVPTEVEQLYRAMLRDADRESAGSVPGCRIALNEPDGNFAELIAGHARNTVLPNRAQRARESSISTDTGT